MDGYQFPNTTGGILSLVLNALFIHATLIYVPTVGTFLLLLFSLKQLGNEFGVELTFATTSSNIQKVDIFCLEKAISAKVYF